MAIVPLLLIVAGIAVGAKGSGHVAEPVPVPAAQVEPGSSGTDAPNALEARHEDAGASPETANRADAPQQLDAPDMPGLGVADTRDTGTAGTQPEAAKQARGTRVAAQPATRGARHTAKKGAGGLPYTAGVVRGVVSEDAQVVLEHGPIQNLELPAGVSAFSVAKREWLAGLLPGDQVEFVVYYTAQGTPVILRLGRVGESAKR